MSPEQKKTGKYNFKSDVFLLGHIVHFMLTGKFPKVQDGKIVLKTKKKLSDSMT